MEEEERNSFTVSLVFLVSSWLVVFFPTFRVPFFARGAMCFLAVYYTCHRKNKTYLSSIVLLDKFISWRNGKKCYAFSTFRKGTKIWVGFLWEKTHTQKKLSNLHFSLCTHSEGVVAVCFPSKEDWTVCLEKALFLCLVKAKEKRGYDESLSVIFCANPCFSCICEKRDFPNTTVLLTSFSLFSIKKVHSV